MSYYKISTTNTIVLAFGLLVFFACAQDQKPNRKVSVYYSLDSLLDAQIHSLSRHSFSLEKTIIIDGQKEEKTLKSSSEVLENEFLIIRDFDLNTARNVEAYKTTTISNKIRYDLIDLTFDAPVKYFLIVSTDSTKTIEGEFFEDKSIYQHQRFLHLELTNGILKKYEIRGFQNMVMRDTIRYHITGRFNSK